MRCFSSEDEERSSRSDAGRCSRYTFSTRQRWLVSVSRVFHGILDLNEEQSVVNGDEQRGWVQIDDPELVALLDQLLAYVEEYGGFEWTDPSLTPRELAQAELLADEALQQLRER